MIDSYLPIEAAKRLRAAISGGNPLFSISDLSALLDSWEELREEREMAEEFERAWDETSKKTPEQLRADLLAAGIDVIASRRRMALRLSSELTEDVRIVLTAFQKSVEAMEDGERNGEDFLEARQAAGRLLENIVDVQAKTDFPLPSPDTLSDSSNP